MKEDGEPVMENSDPNFDSKQESSPDKQPDVLGELTLPDLGDERYTTTRGEIYAYYGYYVGCNGLTLFNFAPTAFQNLISQAAGETGMLRFAGSDRSVNSIVLLSNGISFAIQVVVFLTVGSFADFGNWRPYVLIIHSLIAYAVGFGWLGIHDVSKWQAGVGLYIVGLIAYQVTYTFWNAAFPGLARNTPEVKEKADAYIAGTITRDDYDFAESLMRSRLANVGYFIQSFSEIFILAIIVGILFGLKVRESEANNNWGISVIIAFGSAVWLVVSIPWFFLEKPRPGQDPGKRSIVVAGFWQILHAAKAIWKLKQSLIYLIGFFFLGDSMNTTFTVIATLQNEIVAYDSLMLTYLLIVAITAQGAGVGVFFWCQQRFKIGNKTMFNIVAAAIVVLDAWGLVGIWTDRFGFHNLWEFWVRPPLHLPFLLIHTRVNATSVRR
ncbi:putative autophagy protein [Trichoderma chlorosporum]